MLTVATVYLLYLLQLAPIVVPNTKVMKYKEKSPLIRNTLTGH